MMNLNKKNSTTHVFGVNCLTPNGGVKKHIPMSLGFRDELVVGLAEMDLRQKSIYDLQPKTSISGGKLHIEGLDCKTADGLVKETLNASAIIPTKSITRDSTPAYDAAARAARQDAIDRNRAH